MRGQSVLKVDAGQRRWELAQIGTWRADKARELPKAPVGRHERHMFAGQHQRQPLGVLAARFHPHCRALHGSSPASFGAAAHGGEELGQGQIPLVRRAREPLRGHAADPLATAYVHPIASGLTTSGVLSIQLVVGHPHDGRREPLSRLSTRHR
jgi:hypothetical protein